MNPLDDTRVVVLFMFYKDADSYISCRFIPEDQQERFNSCDKIVDVIMNNNNIVLKSIDGEIVGFSSISLNCFFIVDSEARKNLLNRTMSEGGETMKDIIKMSGIMPTSKERIN